MTTPGIADFLLARFAEDEERGRNCQDWSECGEGYGCPAHMSPARWAAECEARRRIVSLHKPYRRIYGLGCDSCLQPRHVPPDAEGWPCVTLRLLALPYADHEDYDEAWRP